MKDQINRRTNHVKKSAPPDQTNAENFYYMKQMQANTPMVFPLHARHHLARTHTHDIPPRRQDDDLCDVMIMQELPATHRTAPPRAPRGPPRPRRHPELHPLHSFPPQDIPQSEEHTYQPRLRL